MDWNGCRAVTDEPEVSAWLQSKALDPRAIAYRDLARSASSPPRLVLPRLRANGRIAGLYQLRVAAGDGKPAAPPEARAGGGRVLANLIGRGLLLRGKAPDWWTWRTVVLVDDFIEFLSWGSSYADAEDVPAVFLVTRSGWTREFQRRIPDGSRVMVRTLQLSATSLVSELGGRCEVIVRR